MDRGPSRRRGHLPTVQDTRTSVRTAKDCSAGVPSAIFQRAVDAGKEAIALLLNAGVPPSQIGSLAGKLIDKGARADRASRRRFRDLMEMRRDPVKLLMLKAMIKRHRRKRKLGMR